jgi:ABC-type Fe3+ transport system permease subunit
VRHAISSREDGQSIEVCDIMRQAQSHRKEVKIVSFMSSLWFILLSLSCLSFVFFLYLPSRRRYARMNQRSSVGREQERGQGLVEYGLALILVAAIVVAILLLLGPTISNTLNRVVTGVSSPSSLYPSSAGPPQPQPTVSTSNGEHDDHRWWTSLWN